MKKQFLLGLMAMLLPLTSWAADEAEETAKFTVEITGADEDGNITYNGDNTTPTITVNVGEEAATAGQYSITYYQVDGETATQIKSTGVRNVGNYRIVVSATGDTYFGYANETVDFSVLPKALTSVTAKEGLEVPYGVSVEDLDLSTLVTLEGVVTKEGQDEDTEAANAKELEDALNCLTKKVTYGEETEVGGTLQLVVLANKEAQSNYVYNGATVSVEATIIVNKLKVAFADGKGSREYDGTTTTLEALKNDIEGLGNLDFTLAFAEESEEGTDIKNAGDYKLKVSLGDDAKGKYEIEEGENLTYTINRKELTITTKVENSKLTKVYDGKKLTWETLKDYFTIDGFVTGEEDELKVTMEQSNTNQNVDANASGYTIMPFVDGVEVPSSTFEEPAALPNYWINYTKTKFVVTPREVTYYFKTTSKPYDNKEVTSLTAEKDYEVVATGFVTREGTETAETFTTPPTPKFADGANGTAVTVKNAGRYSLTVDDKGTASNNYTLKYDDTTTSSDEKIINEYVIAKVDLTVTALDKTIKLGEYDEEDMKDYLTLSEEKLAVNGGDRTGKNVLINYVYLKSEYLAILKGLKESLVIDGDVDYENVGVKTGVIKFAVDKVEHQNYNITLVAGNIIVEGSNEIVLDGDEEKAETPIADVLKTYNGATVEQVTVKNLKSLTDAGFKNDGRWYTLVLPFDVTVREVSNAFGYAIVNVPNTTNADPNKIVFQLEMGTVPANTLMAFKVDNTLDSEDDSINIATGVIFKNKTIVAPAEDHEWVHDAANNYFIGAYASEFISAANQYYLNPKQAKFYPASDQQNTKYPEYGEYGMLINPLNGYVEFSENADLSQARIFIQEADGSTTAINAVTGETIHNAAEGWYTVGGVKLNAQPTEKGIYINNGKKVVIK